MTMKLYCMGESGNAYKAALPLSLSGLDWEPVKVDFFGGETRSPEYRENINEMGEVPVLVDGDLKLTQSGVIQDYISEKSGKFGGATPAERREILRIHLSRRKRDPGQFDLDALVTATEGWSGAELEECVIAGLHAAFARGEELTSEDLTTAAQQTVPLSKTMSEQVEGLRDWARGRARPAS